jgi:exosortase
MTSDTAPRPSFQEELKRLLPTKAAQVAWFVVAVAFVWYYASSLRGLWITWWKYEDYQHGVFVPMFALVLLWVRRDMIIPFTGRGSWWGLPVLGIWALMRWTAIYFGYQSLPELSMLPFFAGLALFVGGWQSLQWSWPAIGFLVFMIPLPGFIQGFASEQLQTIATTISVFVIQTLGIPTVAQGNVIQLSGKPLEVARACSGLRMMMLFFAICIGAVFVVKRPLWERLVIIASAAPIAVLANVTRIVLTGVAYEIAHRWPSLIDLEAHGETIHDWAGYMMMPIGLLLLLAELQLLSKLMLEPLSDRPLFVGGEPTKAGPPAMPGMMLPRRRR